MPATIASQEGTVSEASDEKKYFLTVTYNKTIVINVKHKNMGTVNSIAQIYIDKIKADCETQRPLVAIHCITYNHERFLRDALEGFVSQQTDFPYVAIVHEDKSTDGTAAILREYAEKYPDIIKPIFEEENQYSKPDGSLGAVMNAALNATGAKYVAYCEGDDYWTSPDKLQKQVDVMRANPNCTMCVHKTIFHFVDHNLPDYVMGHEEIGRIIPSELQPSPTTWFQTSSVLMVRDILSSDFYKKITSAKKLIFGDIMLTMAAYHYGDIMNIPEIMSLYRIHTGGATNEFIRKPYHNIRCNIAVAKLAGPEYENILKNHRYNVRFGRTVMDWKIFPHNLFAAARMFWYTPGSIIKYLSRSIPRYFKNRLTRNNN